MSVINKIYCNHIIINNMSYTFVNLRDIAFSIISANTLAKSITKCIEILKIKWLMLFDITF